MDTFSFILSVIASVVANYICLRYANQTIFDTLKRANSCVRIWYAVL